MRPEEIVEEWLKKERKEKRVRPPFLPPSQACWLREGRLSLGTKLHWEIMPNPFASIKNESCCWYGLVDGMKLLDCYILRVKSHIREKKKSYFESLSFNKSIQLV